MPNFSSPDGDLLDILITETDLIDRFVGNQIWTWGLNSSGQLGDNSTIARSSPVQTASGGTNWTQVVDGGLGASAAFGAGIKTDNTLWTWGPGIFLGDNTSIAKSSPVQTVSGGTNWRQVSAAANHVGAVKTDGTLWMWGTAGSGQLGNNNSSITRSSPVQTVAAGTNWKFISCGKYHVVATKTDGTLWAWGRNLEGQLGNNDATNRSSPIQTVAAGTNWNTISAGSTHTAAIKTDGTLWLWGDDTGGALGQNSVIGQSSPVQTVSGGTNWRQVSCGVAYTAAIKTDNTLWTWGSNVAGQLGDNTRINRSSPVQTVSSGTNWKQVSCGDGLTGSIKTDGTMWLWGLNTSGPLGDNTRTNKSSPVQTITGGANWKKVICGKDYVLAITYTQS